MKHTFPPEFEKLTPDQLNQVHVWLDEFAYRVVQQKLVEAFALKISLNKLCRYNQHRELAEELSDDSARLAAREVYQMLNSEAVPFTAATLFVIEQRVFQQVLRNDLTVGKLVALHKLSTYQQRHSLDQRRLAITEKRLRISSVPLQTNSPASAALTSMPHGVATPPPAGIPNPPPVSTPKPLPAASSPPATALHLPAAAVAHSTPGDSAGFRSQKYSPTPSPAEHLLASQTLVLPDPQGDFLVQPPIGATPPPPMSASLLRELPSEPIPFPSACFRKMPLAA